MSSVPHVQPVPTGNPPSRRIRLAAIIALLASAVQPSNGLTQQFQASKEEPASVQSPHPLDEPLRLIAESRQAYQAVKDYSCIFVKQERVNGKLLPQEVISMKVRTQPFSVYMFWQNPEALKGQEACYVEGKNNGKMRAKPVGLLSNIGFISIDLNSPRAMKNNRHTVAEAGIGNIISQFNDRWLQERPFNKPQVRMGEALYNKRRCTSIEVAHPGARDDRFYSCRSVLYLDKETHLPLRVENYDWPTPGGKPGGEPFEIYSFVNLRTNVGLPDEVFNK